MNIHTLKPYAAEISAAEKASENSIEVVVKAYGLEPIDTVKTDATDVSLLSDATQERIAAEYRNKHGYPDDVFVGIWDARFLKIVKGGTTNEPCKENQR